MARLSPKIEIINHFDNLINRVDIEIEECLKKCNENQLLSEWKRYERQSEIVLQLSNEFKINKDNTKYNTGELWSESTKVVDYLNQVRMRTIKMLTKEQKEALEYYKRNSSSFQNQLKEGIIKIEELKSQLFGEKFYFQVLYKPPDWDNWIFNLYTICADFYISQDDIKLLEEMLKDQTNTNSKDIFDEHMVLMNLIFKKFFDYINSKNYPDQIIDVRKKDILDVQIIYLNNDKLSTVNLTSSTIDLSKIQLLEIQTKNIQEIKLDGLDSLMWLKLKTDSIKRVVFGNLLELRKLEVKTSKSVNLDDILKTILETILETSPNIEYLNLVGEFFYFDLDNLVKLNELRLTGTLNTEGFNFDLFKNLCIQLTKLEIDIANIDDTILGQIFNRLHFPNLKELGIKSTKISKLEKKLFDGFSNLVSLQLSFNKHLKIIDNDAFSNLKQLRKLDLSYNSIESLKKEHFSQLINLETLDLCTNEIKSIEDNIFSNLNILNKLGLSNNKIENVNSQSFAGLQNLIEFDMASNKLKEFDMRIFDIMNKIENIYLDRNSINNKDEILSRFKDSTTILLFI